MTEQVGDNPSVCRGLNKYFKITGMNKIRLINILILICILPALSGQGLVSGVFNWDKLEVKKTSSGEVRNYFKSPTKDLEMFEVDAVKLDGGKAVEAWKVPEASDELIIMKEGSAEIKVNDEEHILGEGSVVVASAGSMIAITNNQKSAIVYYSFLFKPLNPATRNPGEAKASPLFIDWDTVEFKPNANGGRRDIMRQSTSAMRELEIHVTTLKEGVDSHAPHSHPDEEFVLMRYGNADMNLDGKDHKGGPGSLFFLASGGMHGLDNVGNSSCEYFAIRWLTGSGK